MLGASVTVPENYPGLQPSQIPPDTGADQANRGQLLEIITVKDLQNIGTPPQQSPYNSNVWAGTNLRPVCPLFCSDATADINIRGQYCLGPCRVVSLKISDSFAVTVR
ncbi:hypothetical protein MMC07_008578 [Pseudocyphellaria aurata]|nr:hypothetical protein [Pseudocyphellaria aurata]